MLFRKVRPISTNGSEGREAITAESPNLMQVSRNSGLSFFSAWQSSLAEKYLSELAQKSQASIKESPKESQIVMDEFAKLFLAVNFLIRKGDNNE